jgi:hypothetical protein
VYAGEANLASATFTIENPGGEFVGLDGAVLPDQENPEITLENDGEDKSIDLAVSDAWENSGNSNVQFTVTLVSATTTDDAEIVADPETDIVRSITVLPKPVIGFKSRMLKKVFKITFFLAMVLALAQKAGAQDTIPLNTFHTFEVSFFRLFL